MKDTSPGPISVVMDENFNPLARLPKALRFQIMVILSVMWTTIFCLSISSWLWWGELVIGHVAIALGILATGATFESARRQTVGHRQHYRASDGTARYDDLWGA